MTMMEEESVSYEKQVSLMDLITGAYYNKDCCCDKDTFNGILDEMRDIHNKKNQDYGSSFTESLNEDGLLASKIRLGDKYRRFSQLINNPAQVKNESIEDTLIDMANYAVMTVEWIRNNRR